MKPNLAMLAIGGNSLIKDKDRISLSFQYEAVKETTKHIAALIKDGLQLVISHGNGPQVGFILRRSEIAEHELPLIPLDICGADTQGAIKYMIEKALLNEFGRGGIDRKIAAVVTQTLVDKDDPSFREPNKPIGSFMEEGEAKTHRTELGWDIVEDAGRGYRRVVASPKPLEILELDAIRLLMDNGYIVLAAGGGGVPVIRNEKGEIESVEAVIDKDLASALLANKLGIETLVISTAVDMAYLNFDEEDQEPLKKVSLEEIKGHLEEGHFKPGSMKPKIEAIIQFLENGGKKAIITTPENLLKAYRGEAGTTVTR